MSQVLHGLLYLHEQGVIHRDIKGANILTTKEGLVKLADFGVATRATGLHESSVVGTPYWMAPEVIELSGATTASDIWSLGCTVIELLDGKPPYHKLAPMPALFRIVNDDHPPLPESVSPTVQDFLMQCFQKDPNMRVSARKLLKHPWIVNARRTDSVVPVKPTKYDEAVKSVQQWNEALKSPESSIRKPSRESTASPLPNDIVTRMRTPMPTTATTEADSAHTTADDVWDNDFASSINSTALQLPHLKPVDNFAGMLSSEKIKKYASIERGSTTTQEYDSISEAIVKSPGKGSSRSDPLRTVRPLASAKSSPTKRKVSDKAPRLVSQPKTQAVRVPLTTAQSRANRPAPLKRSSSIFREDPEEDYSDLVAEDDVAFDQKLYQVLQSKQREASSPKFTHMTDLQSTPRKHVKPRSSGSLRGYDQAQVENNEEHIRGSRLSVDVSKYAEKVEDEDFSDIFGHDSTLAKEDSDKGSEQEIISMLNPKFSNSSWNDDEDDEDDPFAELEENLDEMDMETKVARDKHVRQCALVEGLIGSLQTSQPDDVLSEISQELLQVLFESPEMKSVIISSHGLLPILEVLEHCQRRDVSLQLLKIINAIVLDNQEIQEMFCFVGGIPIVTTFAGKKFPSDVRLEAAAFVRQMYQTSILTLQMFISCGGLNVLVEFLEEDYEAERDLVLIGVNGIWSVLQGPGSKNDFCRIFSRSSVLYPLSLVLNRVLKEKTELGALVEGRIVSIFFLFSQAENHVKHCIADRMVLKRILKDLTRLAPNHQITMLKFIKNISMLGTTLEALQNSNVIEVLTDLLSYSMKRNLPFEYSNQILNIMFNLCRLSVERQEDAALCGLIPLLQVIVQTERPLKEFALPILCDMAHSGKVGRKILWQSKGLQFYVSLLADPYWQVTALDAIFIWLQEETAKVEEHLLNGSFSKAIVQCFVASRADAFENLLEPLQKLLRLSPPVASTLAHPEVFSRTAQKLHNNKKAVVRGNLLRIIESICDSSEAQGSLIRLYGLHDIIVKLSEEDPAVLVRNMASNLMHLSALSTPNNRTSMDGNRYQPSRRPSAASTPSSLYGPPSQPPTPQALTRASITPSDYFDNTTPYSPLRARPSVSNAFRPISRDGTPTSIPVALVTTAAKSRLPQKNPSPIHARTGSRPTVAVPRKDDVFAPAQATTFPNQRRRRQTSGS